MTTRASIENSLPLLDMFIARNNSKLIHDLIAPTIYCDKTIGHYYKLQDHNLIPESTALGGRSGANEIFHGYTKQQFEIEHHGLKEFLDYSVIESSDWFSMERMRKDMLFMIKDKLLLGKEKALADILTNPANFPGMTSALTGTSRWDNASSDPTVQFKLAKQQVRLKSGRTPNTLILGARVNDALSYNATLADKVSMTNNKVVSKAILGQLLNSAGLEIPEERIIVGEAQMKTSISSPATYIWDDIALFCYIDPNSTTMFDDTLVKQFRLKGNKGVKIGFYKEPDPTVLGEWATGQIDYGFKLVNFECGYLFTTVVS
jgi:hypothetical protein